MSKLLKIITPAGRAEALRSVAKRTDPWARRVRELVAEAEAAENLRERLAIQQALHDEAPTPAEIEAAAAEVRATWCDDNTVLYRVRPGPIERRPANVQPTKPKREPMGKSLDWPKRARCDQTDVAKRRVFTTACGRYRAVEIKYTLRGLGKAYQAHVLIGGGWDILSRHKSLDAAKKACQRHARQWGLIGTT